MSETQRRAEATTLPDWAAALFGRPLVPLAQGPIPSATVWAIEGDRIAGRISEQFKAGAGEYHARYAASAHFQSLFEQTLSKLGLTVPEAPLIFDMGSGSGVNSIVPCFSLFPGARQVASDLSGDLLVMLADYAAAMGLSDRVVCVVMDAMGANVLPERFDLVTGASILHHLVRPVHGLQAAARALKPGGQAIFFEPFDGYGLLRLAYERILAEAALRGEALAPEAERVLRAMTADIAARTNPDWRAPGFSNMDDKWLFSREAFEGMARNAGFESVRFLPHNNHPTLYRDVAAVQLRLGSGLDDLTLPAWANDILDGFDRALPMAAKNQMMLEGSVVLTRAA
ncbi:class I SAM-dependent methyltransferase [Phenylobacterium sp.]|jgi:SAM-dependent methyltransferase|uniref:class I SAM-dependent methyltransferase n=1 Tax=Phenylobacterium sp. TaxID=1871053 RepID=UPI0012067720|nr:class I SAM-dependent methyltransferase [Phenylobacterium sp.]THD54341.1 MAG: class I SAM-dependent methyltransferase [Phenylobacterium sp.]